MPYCPNIRIGMLFQRKALLCGLLILLSLGCQRRSPEWNPGEPFKTQIVVGSSQGAEFKKVELMGVRDKSTLAGEIVQFYFAPGVEDNHLVGQGALTHFVEADGVYIPADQITLQMVTIYYHLQELKKLELQARQVTTSWDTWPRKVALSVRVNNAPDLRYNNAFYSAPTDTMFFVPYEEKDFPIPLNPGIIAHEHFHSYFAHEVLDPLLVAKKLPPDMKVTEFNSAQSLKDIYNLYTLKIMNEGLADVWGWIYSQDPDFVAISLAEKVGQARNLDKSTKGDDRISSAGELKADLSLVISECGSEATNCFLKYAYAHGTQLARGLKAFALVRMQETHTSAQDMRAQMAEKVLDLIKAIHTSFNSEGTITLDTVVQLWQKQFDSLSSQECAVLQQTASSSGVISCGSDTSSSAH